MIVLQLTEDEIKSIKKQFYDGKVYTDGCFCGHAIASIRDNLAVVLDFSCRKSMNCKGVHYQVNNVYVVEKASSKFSEGQLKLFLRHYLSDERSDKDWEAIESSGILFLQNHYDDPTIDDMYVERKDIKLDEVSLKAVQKRLFKYYKNEWYMGDDVRFKDINSYKYNSNEEEIHNA